MTCPVCGLVAQQEDDGVSKYVLCWINGHMTHLTRQGQPYVPPAPLAYDDLGDTRRLQTGGEHQPRAHRDGCKHHSSCFTCPFSDCILGQKEKKRRHPNSNRATSQQVTAEVVRAGMDPTDRSQRQMASERLRKQREGHSAGGRGADPENPGPGFQKARVKPGHVCATTEASRGEPRLVGGAILCRERGHA